VIVRRRADDGRERRIVVAREHAELVAVSGVGGDPPGGEEMHLAWCERRPDVPD
jgi:hypothetical protein